MLPLGCAFLALAPTPPPGGIELPPGPAADAAARIAPDTEPAALPAIPEDAWSRPATWKRFAELLSAEARGAAPDPSRRAELALLALAQRRWEDAWARFADCAASPAIAAALLPRFLPGAAKGDLPADGAVLAPALPPLVPGGPEIPRGAVQRRAMKIDALAVGQAKLSLKVSVEGEGVEIDVEHLSGGAAKLAISIPEHPEFGYADEYVDWIHQEARGVAHEVTVAPGDEVHTLYARFEPRRAEWPTRLPASLPAQIEHGTVWLDPGPGGEDRALLESVAECLSAGPLRLAARIGAPRGEKEEGIGIRIDLSHRAERPRKLAWIAGALEERALARPPAAKPH